MFCVPNASARPARKQGAGRHPDLMGRQFTASNLNALWVTDLTFGATWAGVAYVRFYRRRVFPHDRRLARRRPHAHSDGPGRDRDGPLETVGCIAPGCVRCHSDAGAQGSSRRFATASGCNPGSCCRHRGCRTRTMFSPEESGWAEQDDSSQSGNDAEAAIRDVLADGLQESPWRVSAGPDIGPVKPDFLVEDDAGYAYIMRSRWPQGSAFWIGGSDRCCA